MLRKRITLRAYENRVLKRIFRFKGAEVISWKVRKLHNPKLPTFYPLQNITRLMKSRHSIGASNTKDSHEKWYRIFVEKLEEKIPLVFKESTFHISASLPPLLRLFIFPLSILKFYYYLQILQDLLLSNSCLLAVCDNSLHSAES
jgi:hypothetical protein